MRSIVELNKANVRSTPLSAAEGGMTNEELPGAQVAFTARSKLREIINFGWVRRTISLLPPAIIPPIHIAAMKYFWWPYNLKVDKSRCSCSCWDTVFKGPYETGVSSYKHVYFNASENNAKIWMVTVVSIIVFYETVKRLIELGLKNQLRYSMLSLFIMAVFSHYYSWWSYLNYWNDEFYEQWNHQLYFTITEIVSTYLVLKLANKKQMFTRGKVFVIVGIAVTHIVAGSVDQFILNVLKASGQPHQVLRDVWFMIPDIMHMIVPIIELSKSQKPSHRTGLLTATAVLVLFGLFVFSLL